MQIKNTRLKEIDILYTIGSLLVIFGHSHPNTWNLFEGTFFYHCIVFIYTFHMPLFFLINGILLFRSNSIENKPFNTFICDKAKKLLVPYFFVTAITFIPKAYLEYRNLSFLKPRFILQIFFNPRNNTWGHFWFLPVLFICYIIFGGIKKAIAKTSNKFTIVVLTACCVLFLAVLLFAPNVTDWFGINDIFDFAFYVPLGMLLSFLFKEKKEMPHILLLTLMFLAVSAAITLYVLHYQNIFARFTISILMLFTLLGLSCLLKNKMENFFTFFSNNIFSIYIYSWPFQSFVLIVLEKLNISWQISAPIMFVSGICCPLIIITVYKRCKKLNCRFFDLILGIR